MRCSGGAIWCRESIGGVDIATTRLGKSAGWFVPGVDSGRAGVECTQNIDVCESLFCCELDRRSDLQISWARRRRHACQLFRYKCVYGHFFSLRCSDVLVVCNLGENGSILYELLVYWFANVCFCLEGEAIMLGN